MVVSAQGKEAVVAVLMDGAFFAEGCLTGQQLRMANPAFEAGRSQPTTTKLES